MLHQPSTTAARRPSRRFAAALSLLLCLTVASPVAAVPSADIVRTARNFVSYSARNCAFTPVAGHARTWSERGDNRLGALPYEVW